MDDSWFSVKNKSEEKGEIYIYGNITGEKWDDKDVTPVWFKNETDKLRGKKNIDLFVNSGGGGVFAGMAIYNVIKRLSANVVAHIDGIAASTASWIIQAANKIIMPENALMMIHNPVAIAAGTADHMREMASFLDKTKGVIIDYYKRGKNVDEKKISDLMDAETWMNGKEALELGFVDVLEPAKNIVSSVNGITAVVNGVEFNTSVYKNFPTLGIAPKSPQVINTRRIEAQKKILTFNTKGAK